MPGPLDYGVQSWCFRHFKTNPEVAAKVNEIGLSKIELCGVHADFENPAAFGDVAKTYADAGVEIISMGVQTFVGDAAKERKWFECAKAAGAKHLSAHFRVDSFHDAVPATAKLAEEFDMRIGLHCHGGYMFGGSPDEIEHILKIGGPRIGLCIDTAWCMQIGPQQGKPVEWVKRFGDRVYGVHYKDFIFDRNAQWNDVVVGTGNLDLPAFVTALQNAGFDGYAVIEYEADVENPVPALTKCVEKMRALTA